MAGTAARLYLNRWAAAKVEVLPVRAGRGAPRPVKKTEYDIPGLEPITYAGRMHYVPGLAKPKHLEWTKDWYDPHHHIGPRLEQMPLWKSQPCFIFHQRTKLLEGVKQALWLTKSKLISGLPDRVLKISEDCSDQFENQDEQVQKIIARAFLWSNKETEPERTKFCPVLVRDVLQFCRMLTFKHPMVSRRALAENYRLATSWNRESDLFRVCGLNGALLNAKSPLEPLASRDEVLATANHVLETFDPISPTIDLQETHVYEEFNDPGFKEGYPYAHPHTLYLTNVCNPPGGPPFNPEHLRAKMIMFAFGNALANAKRLYGEEAKVLDRPVVVQSVATDGRLFQFLVLQLNTTDLNSSDGVKNLIWIDSDQLLYDYANYLPKMKKKVVLEPAGVFGYQPETFSKFLAMYLHGVM
ncbi:large ribosomal subunit protein mL37 [Ambystoma mexicanum]|uniref:large ribosomal subunit protein mL37 n=1 Tax=Ambystoma mexicanum TaxID=8296 RepID=UPI0037E86F86